MQFAVPRLIEIRLPFVDQAARHYAYAVDFTHDQSRVSEDLVAGRGNLGEASSVAPEQFHAEFFLEQAKLFAYAGLRRVKPIRGGCDVEAIVRDRDEVSELLQFQFCIPSEEVFN
jgi:hypothetical protein